MFKKIIGLTMVVLLTFSFSSCIRNKEEDDLEWNNSNAIYAFIKAGHEHDILNDVEGAFKTLPFKKVYVTEKNIDEDAPLVLLFILDESRVEEIQTFIDILNEDERVNYVNISRDLYFDTVDTRHIEKSKNTILVGESLKLEMKGNIDYYVKPFGDEGLFIKLEDDKVYTVEDFPQINLNLVELIGNDWYYLELTNSGYFEVIKAADVLSRLSTINNVELDKREISMFPPDVWGISNTSIAAFESTDGGGYPTAIIKGISVGVVTITFGDISCEIIITSNE